MQRHGDRVLVQNPPTLPLTEREMDAAYDLPVRARPTRATARRSPPTR